METQWPNTTLVLKMDLKTMYIRNKMLVLYYVNIFIFSLSLWCTSVYYVRKSYDSTYSSRLCQKFDIVREDCFMFYICMCCFFGLYKCTRIKVTQKVPSQLDDNENNFRKWLFFILIFFKL